MSKELGAIDLRDVDFEPVYLGNEGSKVRFSTEGWGLGFKHGFLYAFSNQKKQMRRFDKWQALREEGAQEFVAENMLPVMVVTPKGDDRYGLLMEDWAAPGARVDIYDPNMSASQIGEITRKGNLWLGSYLHWLHTGEAVAIEDMPFLSWGGDWSDDFHTRVSRRIDSIENPNIRVGMRYVFDFHIDRGNRFLHPPMDPFLEKQAKELGNILSNMGAAYARDPFVVVTRMIPEKVEVSEESFLRGDWPFERSLKIGDLGADLTFGGYQQGTSPIYDVVSAAVSWRPFKEV